MTSGKDILRKNNISGLGVEAVLAKALSSVPPRTHTSCFHQRISKEESAIVRGNSKAGFLHWGCQGPESGRVLPKVTQQEPGAAEFKPAVSLHAVSHRRLTSYFIVTS